MEREKRTIEGGNADSASRKKARLREYDQGGQTAEVTEGEVEEFFAILRRIHEAVRYFRKGDGDGHNLTDGGSRSSLRQAIEWECSQDVNGVKSVNKEKRREGGELNVCFDLNADPNPDDDLIQAAQG